MSAALSKEKKLDLIYRHTHQDFKGIASERWGVHAGHRTIMVNTPKGSAVTLLEWLDDGEIEARLALALRNERTQPSVAA